MEMGNTILKTIDFMTTRYYSFLGFEIPDERKTPSTNEDYSGRIDSCHTNFKQFHRPSGYFTMLESRDPGPE